MCLFKNLWKLNNLYNPGYSPFSLVQKQAAHILKTMRPGASTYHFLVVKCSVGKLITKPVEGCSTWFSTQANAYPCKTAIEAGYFKHVKHLIFAHEG